MARKKSEDSSIIEVNGLLLKKDSLYIIENKLDKDAPDGFQREGTTKIPSEGVSNLVTCRYVMLNDTEGIYDTGLFISSPCYRGLSEEEKKSRVKTLTEHIVNPYETNFGGIDGKGILDAKNVEFWDKYAINLYEGRVFNTSDIKDLLDLFIAVNSFDLTPVGKEGSPAFNQSDYMIKDSEVSMNIHQKRAVDKMDAIEHFSSLKSINFNDLVMLMKYLNIIKSNINPDERELKVAFNMWLEKDYVNAELFENAYKMIVDDVSREEIILTVKVKKLISSSRIKKEGKDYFYKGIPLGIDVKSIVKTLTTSEELSEIRDDIRLA